MGGCGGWLVAEAIKSRSVFSAHALWIQRRLLFPSLQGFEIASVAFVFGAVAEELAVKLSIWLFDLPIMTV